MIECKGACAGHAQCCVQHGEYTAHHAREATPGVDLRRTRLTVSCGAKILSCVQRAQRAPLPGPRYGQRLPSRQRSLARPGMRRSRQPGSGIVNSYVLAFLS
jgi:hypothetical protein